MKYLFLLVLVAITVAAMPQLPVGYYGTVKDSDRDLMGGVEVVVKDINGIELTTDMTNAEGKYSLIITWDDPDTDEREGVVSGERILFYVNGDRLGSTTVGQQGADIEFNIHYDYEDDSSSSSSSSSSGSSGGLVSQPIEELNETDTTSQPVADEPDNQPPVSKFDEVEEKEDDLEEKTTAVPKTIKEGTGEEEFEGETSEGNNSGLRLVLILFGIAVIVTIIYFILKKRGVVK